MPTDQNSWIYCATQVIHSKKRKEKKAIDWPFRPLETKWFKKEILGHFIDSAINNLQRFTEIQYSKHLFVARPYDQNELVKPIDMKEQM